MEVNMKYDQDKLRFDLIEPDFERELAKVLTHGAIKYGEENWKTLDNAKQRYIAALKRHLNDFQQGVTTDIESGCRITAHIAANVMFLDYFLAEGQTNDLVIEVHRNEDKSIQSKS